MCKRLLYLVSFVLVLGLVSNAGGQIASNPIPADGSDHEDNYAALGWTAGAGAVSHNVYFGDNFAHVEAGTGGTFRGNKTETAFLVGLPDSPYPQGLVRGTTYYWRIDEVEADGTVRTGQVWSFTIIGPTARDPNPPDAGRFVDPNVELSWSIGFGAVMHYVYFGDNIADVNAGTGDTYKGMVATTAYTPGPLEMGKTYFWRVDEYDGTDTHKGDVWRFTTRPVIPIFDPNLVGWWKLDDEGTGTIIDYSGYNRDGTIHGDPQFALGVDGDALEFDGDDYVTIDGYKGIVGDGTDTPAFSITAWVRKEGPDGGYCEIVGWGSTGSGNRMEFRFNNVNNRLRLECGGGSTQSDTPVPAGEWHHIAMTVGRNSTYENGVEFYLDGALDTRANTDPDPIHPISDFDVIIGMRYNQDNSRWFIGALDDIRIYDKVLTAEEVGRAMQGDPRIAWAPYPGDGSEPFIEDAATLSWTPGDTAAKHDVYLGASEIAVAGADITDTTGIYRGRQDSNSYSPAETLEFGETYYWRIDEVAVDGTTIFRGRIWSFTIANYIVVDDFEGYDAGENQIWYAWRDGLGYGSPDSPPYYAGNGTGSEVGDGTTVSYTEESIVHGGVQSMPYWYDNNKQDKMKYSEATKTLSSVRDWTKHGVKALSLWFIGYPPSVSSFTEAPAGTYTMTVRSGLISDQSDEFFFAYKVLSGPGTIIAKVESIRDTHASAQAGVMIRDMLDPNSTHATVVVTFDNGVEFRRRSVTAEDTTTTTADAIAAPQWVKIDRDMGGSITASYSADGITWTDLGTGEIIPMNTPMYIGLVAASNHAQRTCEAKFTNVQITGASGQWMNQDVGILANDPEPMYVAIANPGGTPSVVYHPDPNAAQIADWTEWNIDLKEFSGVNLANVDSISIGLGNRANPQPGGSGKMLFDDIRIYRPRCIPSLLKLQADFNNDCMVNCSDLEMMADDWLESDSIVATTTPDPAGLMAHFKLDGNTNDSSGNSNPGIVNGNPIYVDGMFGQAIHLDGLDDYVAIQDVNYAGSDYTEVTACAWIRTRDEEGQIVTFDRNEYFRLEVGGQYAGGPGLVGWHVLTSTGQVDYGSITRVDDGQWHHVAGTFNNGTLTIYIDGNPQTPALGGPTFGTGETRYGFLGCGSEAGYPPPIGRATPAYLEGDLDEVRIYSRALSPAEIAYLADDTPGDGQLYAPVPSIANISDDESPLSKAVNFKDYAVLAEQWLEEQLWPQP